MRKNKRCQKSKSPQVSYKSLCAWECVGVCQVCACVCILHSSLSHMQVCVSVVTKALIHGGEITHAF